MGLVFVGRHQVSRPHVPRGDADPSSSLAPLVNGYVIDSLGWQYCFIIIAPFFALSLITMIFFMPGALSRVEVYYWPS